jgi:ketosteroid isomerase-like protein
MDNERAERFAEEWYAAWNAHDLDAILDHYTDDVEMVSPLVSMLAGGDDDRLVGKDALRAYFAAGLEKFPALHFEPIELFVGVDSLVLHYRCARGDLAAEVVFLDGEDKVIRYYANYSPR